MRKLVLVKRFLIIKMILFFFVLRILLRLKIIISFFSVGLFVRVIGYGVIRRIYLGVLSFSWSVIFLVFWGGFLLV